MFSGQLIDFDSLFKNRRRLSSGLMLCAAALLSACNSSDGSTDYTATSVFNFPDALSAFFVSEYTPAHEADALQRRTSNSRYRVQKFTGSAPGLSGSHNFYSLAQAHVEYAHAVGLFGAGQIIAIIDNGFLQSHDEFSGKTIYTAPGYGPGVEHHGTAVASIAAGSSNTGEMIGVAPEADLLLGSFATFNHMTAAVDLAADLGAIVQNNSWGFETSVSQSNFDDIFSGTAGSNYISSLERYAQNGVIVFAASNNRSRSQADIMAALPLIKGGLEKSWLTAVSAIPEFEDGEISSATLVSSACLEAAAWCLAANGGIYGASDTANDSYEIIHGTSFAAPQVSGAIALLAEAFPTLSAQELRARLLASANNSFYEHTGFVEFAPGVDHGFDDVFGHGFLDLKAALLPIGGAFVPRTAGAATRAGTPNIVGGGMVGNAITARLASHDILVVDGLGGGFQASADIIAADAMVEQDPLEDLGSLLKTDLNSDLSNPFYVQSVFGDDINGEEISVSIGNSDMSVLMPESGSDSGNFGLSIGHKTEGNAVNFSYGFNVMREGEGFAGLRVVGDGDSLGGEHLGARFGVDFALGENNSLSLTGSVGVGRATGSMTDLSVSTVSYNSLGVSYGARNVFGKGDRFAFGVNLPQAVENGSLEMVIPVSLVRGGNIEFDTLDVDLSPIARQVDISMSYGLNVSRNGTLVMSAKHSLNSGNIEGLETTSASIGWKFEF